MKRNEQQYGLAIHTSSPELGFAIGDSTGNDRLQTWDLGRDVSHQIHDRLQGFLTPQVWSDLGFIAVAKGPGGFTGTRLGVVLARTLAQQLEIPLFGISSLDLIAQAENLQDRPIAVQMPAQRGELYGAIYEKDQILQEETVMLPEAWEACRSMPHILVEAPVFQGKFAQNLLVMGRSAWLAGECPNWDETLPYYGQHPVVIR
jgi:tRNA threonylcarbamoyl adenosine modification protein YeaZ